jgi:hypothetical protein
MTKHSFKLLFFMVLASSCGVVRLSIPPSQGGDPGFKSRREHFCFKFYFCFLFENNEE